MSGIIAQNTLDNSGLIKSPAGGGAWNFIKKLTASGDSNLAFVNGASDVVLDSTYKEYVFSFVDIHPSANQADFGFNLSIDGGSNYNVTKTSTFFLATQSEGASASFEYNAGFDSTQSTGEEKIAVDTGHDNDECNAGFLHLYDPASSVFVKHYMSRFHSYNGYAVVAYADSHFVGGYRNTTSAVNAIRFQWDSGTIDLGSICLYGISS